MSGPRVLALDVGGSAVKSALVENSQHIVGSVCVDEIQSQASAAEILNTFVAIISAYIVKSNDVSRIAVAFPGPFDYELGISLIQNQAKYDALYGINLSSKLKELLGIPTLEVRYRNDAEAAILGEARYGAGVPYARLIGLTLGTGLGSAFVAERSLIIEGDNIPPNGWLYPYMFENQRADDLFSTRGLLARLRDHRLDAVDIKSALTAEGPNQHALAESFDSFGTDLGAFLRPFVTSFGAAALYF